MLESFHLFSLCNFIKKRLQRRRFRLSIAKFLGTPILKSIYQRLLLPIHITHPQLHPYLSPHLYPLPHPYPKNHAKSPISYNGNIFIAVHFMLSIQLLLK